MNRFARPFRFLIALTVASVVALCAPRVSAQVFLANQTVVASNVTAPGAPRAAYLDPSGSGNTFDLSTAGAVYKLAAGCYDYNICGTQIVPASSGNVDLAVSTAGAVYVLNSTAKTITKYTGSGTTYTGAVVVTVGQGANTTLTPVALDMNAAGTLYVAENGTNADIKTYAPTCTSDSVAAACVQSYLGGHPFDAPFTALRIGSASSIAFASSYAGITTFQIASLPNASAVQSFANFGNIPSIGVAANGDVYGAYVVSGGTAGVLRYGAACNCIFNLPGVTTPNAVVSDSRSGVVVYDALAASNRIVGYSVAAADFAAANVGSTSALTATSIFGFPAGKTLVAAPTVLTAGAPNLGFNAAATGNTCTAGTVFTAGATCAVPVTFSPTSGGLRTGAVTFGGGVQALLAGTGTAPLANFKFPVVTQPITDGAAGFRGPSMDGAGNVYVGAVFEGEVDKITPAGVRTAVLTGIPGANGTAVDGAGNLFYFSNSGGTGTLMELYGGTGTPVTIGTVSNPDNTLAADRFGNIYASAQGGAIIKFDANTHASSTYLPYVAGSRFISLAFDAANTLFLANYNTRGFGYVPAGGTYTATGLRFTSNPQGIGVDPGGNLEISLSNRSIASVRNYGSFNYSYDYLTGGNSCCGITFRPSGSFVGVQDGYIGFYDRTTTPTTNFTTAINGTTAYQTIYLENEGNAPLTFSSIVVAPAANFAIAPGGSCSATGTIGVGGNCSVNVTYTAPATAGTTTAGTLTFTDNSLNATAATQVAPLSGLSQAPVATTLKLTTDATTYAAGTVGTATVTVFDQAGNAFTGYNGTATVSASGVQAGSYPSSVTLVNGTGTFQFTPINAGARLLRVAATGFSQVTAYFTVTAGPAVSLNIQNVAGGSNVTTLAVRTGQTFAVNPYASDAYGNVSATASVTATVTAGASGASATAQQNPVLSDTPQTFLANATAGTFTIVFATPGAPSATLTVTNTPPDTFVVTVRTDDYVANNNGLATLCVNQTAGATYQTGGTTNAACSLRDAVAAANGTSGAIITFAPAVASVASPGTITLLSQVRENVVMTITGPGSAALIIDATGTAPNNSGIFDSESDLSFTLSGMTLLNSPGDAVYNDGGTYSLTDIIFNGATSSSYASAELYSDSGYTATMSRLQFLNNAGRYVMYQSGTATLTQTVFQGNTAGTVLDAANSNATLTVSNSVFDSNASTNLGVIYDRAALNLSNDSFTNNSNTTTNPSVLYASNGGAVNIANSTFAGNTTAGTSTISNLNSAPGTIRNSTFFGNMQTGTSSATIITNGFGTVTLTNTIIAGENGVAAAGNCTACTLGTTNLIGVDPKLGALANNGSPTTQTPVLQTLLPLPNSPAVCGGSVATDTTDERGYPRPTVKGGSSCYDIGAVQTNYVIAFTTQPTNVTPGAAITPAPVVTLTEQGSAAAGIPIVLTASAGTLAGTTTVNTTAAGTATFSNVNVPTPKAAETLLATAGPAVTATSSNFVVILPATNTVVVSSVNPSIFGQPVLFTATVTPQTNGAPAVSGGTVSFYDGVNPTPICAAVPSTTNVFTCTTSALSIAVHTVNAVYSGTASYATSTGMISQNVLSPIPFTLADAGANTLALTVKSASAVSTFVTVTPSILFTGTVALSCNGLPANAVCTFSPASLVFTTAPAAAQVAMLNLQAFRLVSANNVAPLTRGNSIALALTFGLPGVMLFGLGARRRKHLAMHGLMLGFFAVALLGLTGITGCSSNSSVPTTAPGTYNFTITATSGATVQTIPVALTVQ